MDSSSAAMDALLKQYERLQRPIDFVETLHERQVKEVPARYVLPSDRRPSRPLQVQQSFPVIDLAGVEDFDQRFKTVSQIAQASQEWGFFQVRWRSLFLLFLFHFCVDYPANCVIVWPSDFMGFQLF